MQFFPLIKMTNPLTPEAILQKVEDNLIYIKLNQWECVYSGDLELILDHYLQLHTENQELKAVLQDNHRLAREFDIAMFGENAAKQASLCDVLSSVRDVVKQRDRAIADVKKLREVLKAVRDCDVPLENDSVPFIGLRELAEYILKSTNHYDD